MKKFERVRLSYENRSSGFLISNADLTEDVFRAQYYYLYRARVNELSASIYENAKLTIDSNLKISQLDGGTSGENVFVVGVIMKKMKYRCSVLYDFADEETIDLNFRDKIRSDNLVSDEDVLEFESDQQIVKLVGNIDKDRFVTGNVVGLYGHITRDDLFEVKEVVFPLFNEPIPTCLFEKDCYIAFISGLSLSSNMTDNANVLFALEKLSNWICAEVYMPEKELDVVQNISRLVIAGESMRISNENIDKQRMDLTVSDKELDKNVIDQFDKLLSRLVSTLPVDIMSGMNDPASLLLPQQPMPRVIFPWAKRFGKLLNTVTNPYKFAVEGLTFLGTSGQNIRDLLRLTVGESPLELMETCLRRGHIFPTVPDSLDGFPFQRQDPFALHELPNVFFAGNQEHLGQSWMEYSHAASQKVSKTLLLTIPPFKVHQTLMLLNLRNFRVTEYDFSQENNLSL